MNVRVAVAYAAMCTIWGTTWLAIKIGLQSIPPVTGAGLRFVIAAAFLWLVARVIRAERGTRAPWQTILVLAATMFGGNYALTYYAETGLASGLVAVLFGTLPFWVYGLGAVLLGERVGIGAVAGAAIALGGVAAISLSGDVHGGRSYVFAILGAAALSAYATVELKRHAATDPFRTLPPAMLVAGAAMIAGGILFEHPSAERALRASSIAALLYLAVLGSGVAFFLNHWLLQRMTAGAVGLSAFVIPVLAVVVGVIAGGERFGAREALGAALVLAGVWTALRAPAAGSAAFDNADVP